ncbi:MAG TPA: hypothetical protein DCS42_00955 [Nitrospiraceae bacterium]|nr:hypothetical protein [Nitrospiraceae bacterium]
MANDTTATAAETAGDQQEKDQNQEFQGTNYEGPQEGETADPEKNAGEEAAAVAAEEQKRAAEVEKSKAHTEPGVQKRIDRESAKRKRAEEDAAYWRGRAEALETGRKAPDKPEGDVSPPWNGSGGQKEAARPKEDDFETHNDYIEALTDWKVQESLKGEQVRRAQTEQKTASDRQQAEFEQAKKTVHEAGVKEYGDEYIEGVLENPDLTITPSMALFITDSDVGHKLAYHLGQNTETAEKIAGMSPVKQAREMLALEQQLKAKQTTKAPEPLTPLKGGAKPAVDWTNPELSTEDRIQTMRERRRARASMT